LRNTVFGCIVLVLVLSSCKEQRPQLDIPAPVKAPYTSDSLQLSKDIYYDKVLGALVGSAIGDAMGASTEMWYRKDIQLKYGYITGLTPAVRVQSPEGTWEHNLMSGATTDDTRWKYLMVKYFSQYRADPSPSHFANFITDYYTDLTHTLGDTEVRTQTDALDDRIEKIDWIKEWARVALAYQNSPEEYQKAQNRFYGGELSCAGQLYTPMFGLLAHSPEEAYRMAYEHSLFDLGYAKDISALVAALTHMTLRTNAMDSILDVATFVDPYGYQDSRLVGRISYGIADASIKNVLAIREKPLVDSLIAQDSIIFKIPAGFPESPKEWVRQEMVYQFLEKEARAIPFHSGEIWQILITGLQFGGGDFDKTLQFIVNYGRDNDTVAAVAGMILGAKEGYANLPEKLKEEVLRVNRENLGIDLELLAKEMADH